MPIGPRPFSTRIGSLAAALTILTALFMTLFSSLPVKAVAVYPSIGFEGWFHSGAWTPVHVEVQTNVDPFDGHLILRVPRGTLRSMPPGYVDVRLPLHQEAWSRTLHRLTLPVVGSPHPLTVQLQTPTGRTAASTDVSLLERATPLPILLVLDPSARSWAWLAAESGTADPAFALAYATGAGALPEEALGLSSLAAVLVSPEFALHSLSPRQEEALQEYVEHGGHLVFIGGASDPTFSDGWARWLGAPLPTAVQHIRTPSGLNVPAWRVAGTEPEEAVSLHQTYQRGAGRLTLVAANPLLLESLRPRTEWRRILDLLESVPAASNSMGNEETLWQILDNTTLPTGLPLSVIATLFAYLILVVLVTHRSGRTPVVLALLPLLITVSAYLIAWQTAATGLRDRVNYAEIRLTHSITNEVVSSRTYGIVGSHPDQEIDVYIRSASPLPFPAPHNSAVEMTARYTSDSLVLAKTPTRLIHEARGESQVHVHMIDDQNVRVRNDGSAPLRHAFLISADHYVSLGTIPAHGERSAPINRQTNAGRVAEAVESLLDRPTAGTRSPSLEAKALSAAIRWALDTYPVRTQPTSVFLVALTESTASIEITPPSHQRRVNVLVIPVFSSALQGGDPV